MAKIWNQVGKLLLTSESIWLNYTCKSKVCGVSFSQFSRSVMSDSLWPHELQHIRPPCPSPTPGVHPNPCPSSWWCHPTISSSVIPFSCPQSFPGSFQMSQLLSSGVSFSSVQFSHSVVSNSLQPHEAQHTRNPCPSPSPGVHWNSHPLSWWCHPAISSSIVPFSSCLQSLPASESFPVSQPFTWGGQSTGVSALASVLPKNTQGWSPLEWTGWISLQAKGISRVFSKTTVQKHQLFGAQISSQSNSHIHTWLLEKP